MQIQGLFPTPLLVGQLDGADALCAQLRQTILRREQETSGVTHSNAGGWQTAPDFLAWGGDEGQTLLHAMHEVVNHYSGALIDGAMVRGALDWRVSAWANINRTGHANAFHFHPGCYWSACFYVDDGGIDGGETLGGALEFSDPRGPMPLMYAPTVKITIAHCATAGLGERIYPKRGMLAMFPSWLGHRVTEYSGTGTRISVAVNFSVGNLGQ